MQFAPIVNIKNVFQFQFLTPEGFCSLMALIGTNGQGIGTSPLAMWVNAVLELTMSDDERQQLDLFIDKLYQYVEEGKNIRLYFLHRCAIQPLVIL